MAAYTVYKVGWIVKGSNAGPSITSFIRELSGFAKCRAAMVGGVWCEEGRGWGGEEEWAGGCERGAYGAMGYTVDGEISRVKISYTS